MHRGLLTTATWVVVVGCALAASVAVFSVPGFGATVTARMAQLAMLAGVVLLPVAAGVLVRWRPASRLWVLTACLSVVWSTLVLEQLSPTVANGPLNSAVLLRPILFFLLLSWPTGRLRRSDRVWFVTYCVAQALAFWVSTQVFEPDDGRFLAVTDWQRLVQVSRAFGASVVLPVGALVLMVSVVRNASRLPAEGQRLHRPIVVAAVVVGGAALALVINDLVGTAAFVDGIPTTLGGIVLTLDYGQFAVTPVCLIVAARRAAAAARTMPATVEIGESRRVLHDALGAAAADASATVAFAVGDGTWVDRDGRRSSAPSDRAVIVRRGDAPVAAVEVADDAAITPEQVERVVTAAGASVELMRVEAVANARRLELVAARDAIGTAGEAARAQLERDLHDGVQQRLVALALQASMAARARGDDEAVAHELRRGVQAARQELAGAGAGMLPALVAAHGLHGSIATLAATSPLDVEIELHCPADVPPDTAAAAWFVVAEAVANATKHAHASRLRISGRVEDGGHLVVAVDDDGRGGADPAGSGLAGLRARVARAGGRLDIDSPTGSGTVVTAHFPMAVAS